MSWIKRKIDEFILKRAVAKVVAYLDGKKTVTGALALILWVAIYAVPAFTPDYNWVTQYATQLRDLLQSSGLNVDNELFNAGVGFTVIGLADKVRKLFKKDN